MKRKGAWGRLLSVVLGIVLIASLVVVACGDKEEEEIPVTLRLSHYLPPTHHLSRNVFNRMASELERRTEGGLKIEVHANSALGEAKDHFDMAVTGLADIAFVVTDYTPGRFPLASIFELPFAYPDHPTAVDVMWDMVQQGYFDEEFGDVKLLFLFPTDLQDIVTREKKIMRLEDLKGLKLRTTGGYMSHSVERLEAIPVSMPVTETYGAIKEGDIDGAMFYTSSIPDYKIEQIIKYDVLVKLGIATCGFVMNKNSWEKLPADIQKIVEDISKEAALEWVAASYEGESPKALEILHKAGVEVYTIPAAERLRMIETLKPLWEEWPAEMNERGLPGAEVYEAFQSTLQKLGAKLPF